MKVMLAILFSHKPLNLKTMKTLFFSTLMMLFVSTGHAQMFNFEVEDMCQREKSDEGTWSSWSEWTAVEMKIDLDLDNDKVILHLNGKMIYKISEYKPEETDSDGDSIHEFVCTDPDGLACRIRLVILKSQNSKIQLYIDYPTNMFAFNLKSL
jgi:hypothetical protein